MRIALMTNNYKPFIGGVPISVERLAKGLQRFIGGIVLPNPFDPIIEEAFRRQPFDVIHVHHPMLIDQTAVYLGLSDERAWI